MEIREDRQRIEIEVVDRALGTLGDVELSIVVYSESFTGSGFAWIEDSRLAKFVEDLRDLDKHRQGSVTLEGMNPDDLRLRICSIDRWGHLAVVGRVAKDIFSGGPHPFRHAVEFGFAFDPSFLPRILSDFEKIASGEIKPRPVASDQGT